MVVSSPHTTTLPRISDPVERVSESLKPIIEGVLRGSSLMAEEALSLASSQQDDLYPLCQVASDLRDQGKGKDVSFSPKVFIPLTRLCRDFCGYCTFRQAPDEADQLYMSPEQVLEVARAGEKLGCTEALLTLGERPEQRYSEARDWLSKAGYGTTSEYVGEICRLLLECTSLLPHSNPGTMSSRELEDLKDVNPSMGMMLESTSPRLWGPGGPHEFAPSKRPAVRIKTLENAGKLKVAFTTGILIGIGETRRERIEALLAIRDLHRRYGHIQEVIIQNFRAKAATPMEDCLDPSTEDLLWTVAVARLLLGPDINLQVPPNLSYDSYSLYLQAGINDWGGISPLTIDYVNPEAPWPQIQDLKQRTEELGFNLRPRLAIYPEYISPDSGFIAPNLTDKITSLADGEGYVKGGIDRYVNNI